MPEKVDYPEKRLAQAVIYQAVKELRIARKSKIKTGKFEKLSELRVFFFSDTFIFWADMARLDPDLIRATLYDPYRIECNNHCS